ncbi:MAG: sugar phosphate nucleotidyltransferase [Planctomycetes bacterium]|jgi:mannose-1-phosphate guanylyltransferase|nr:sugar phosphate nucleotidyltransferase [Planctomycetota bacterium]
MSSLHAVIMAGGSGTRFWPASRQRRPKQFLPLARGQLLIRATLERLQGLCPVERTWIVTNPQQGKALGKLLLDFPSAQILIEPEPRDTAPCVALATAAIAARDPGATMVVMPADHVIAPVDAFQRLLRRGAELCADGRTLVTFGIAPTHPATGYGYIECGERLDQGTPTAFLARRFREKPDRATAEQFLAAGNFRWNSGIFAWTTDGIRAAMAAGNPALADGTTALLAAVQRGDRRAITRVFKALPKTSIDYGVMEKAPRIAVVDAALQWDDVGSFPALTAVGDRDAAGNVSLLTGGAQQACLDAADNIVYAEGERTVALFGVRDLVVVAVGDAVMVCPKHRADDLKQLVEHLRATGRTDLL